MTSRPFSEFPCNEQGLVGNFLGSAYDTVKRVADNLPELQRLDGVLGEIEDIAETVANTAVVAAMVPVRIELAAATAHVEEVAESIQENLLVNATTQVITAKGTETTIEPDEDTIIGFAGRSAYMSLTKVAFGPVLSVGSSIVPMSSFVGSVLNPKNFTGFHFLVLRGGLPTSIDNLYDPTLDRVTVTGALAGDRLIAVEQDIGGGDISKAPVTADGVTKLLREWVLENKNISEDLAAPDGAGLVGWTRSPLVSATSSVARALSGKAVNVWEYANLVTFKPNPLDSGTWDWTPAFDAAIALMIGSGPIPLATDGFIEVPTGVYHISSINLGQRVGMLFVGGIIKPLDVVTSRTHLIKLGGFNRIYNPCIDMDYALNYDTAVWCRGRYIDIINPDIWKARCAYIAGDPAWATNPALGVLGDSEITINGGNTNWGITVARLYGQNTIVNFGGGHKAYCLRATMEAGDPRKAAWEALPEVTFITCGALLYMTGCLTGNYSSNYANFVSQLQPVSGDPAYRNSYGKVVLNGCHVESGFLMYCEPSAYPVEDTTTTCLQMSGTHGYIKAGTSFWINLGNCKQPADIRACGFYGEPRANLVYAAEAKVYIDPRAVSNYPGDFAECNQIRRMVGYSNFCPLNVSTSSQAFTPAATNLRCTVFGLSDVSSTMNSLWYTTATGVAVAQTELKNVEVSVNLGLASGLATDQTDIVLNVNGVQVDIFSSLGANPRGVLRTRRIPQGSSIEVKVSQYQSRSSNGTASSRFAITCNV